MTNPGFIQVDPNQPPDNERTLAMLSYLIGIFSILGPIIILIVALAQKPTPRFAKFHAIQALAIGIFLAVTVVFLVLINMIFTVATLFGNPPTAEGPPDAGFWATFGIATILLYLLVAAVWVFCLVLNILGAVRSYRGAWWRAPLFGRFVAKP